jgi:hypothetical protein
MADSETRTYTIWNRDSTVTYINSIIISTDPNVSHHIDFPSGWNGPYNNLTNFTANTTVISQPVTYLSDVGNQVKQYVTHSGTNLVINSTASLVIGYTLSLNGYSAGQTITGWGSTNTVITSSGPNDLTGGKPIVGDNIIFSPPEYSMQVSNNTGVAAGWVATGNGYNGQTATGLSSTNYIIMSGPPTTSPTPSGTVGFSDPQPVLILSPESSSTFTTRYTNNTNNIGSYDTAFTINALSTVSMTKLVINYVGIGTAPVDPGGGGLGGFDFGGPGDDGGPGTGAPGDGNADGIGGIAGDANAGEGGTGGGDGSGVGGDSATA